MVYLFGTQLVQTTLEEAIALGQGAIILTDSKHCRSDLEQAGICYEGEIDLKETTFCKVEVQQECINGSFAIPKLLDVLGSRYRMLFFINTKYVMIVDDDDFARRLVARIQRGKINQGDSKARFLYNFTTEFMNRDMLILEEYERRLIDLEERAMHGHLSEFLSELMPIRKKLLILRGYYDQLGDVGKELEENENHFFVKKQLKYFGTLTDRAERLMGKTLHLLDYAQQVKDAYQAQIDARQNSNMQFLTIISTIFFPLTLITGWYGMNFENMPELKNGYPAIIILSLLVVAVCIYIFKKKKIL